MKLLTWVEMVVTGLIPYLLWELGWAPFEFAVLFGISILIWDHKNLMIRVKKSNEED